MKTPPQASLGIPSNGRNALTIALFELTVEGGNALIVEERHYRLVPAEQIDTGTKRQYAERS